MSTGEATVPAKTPKEILLAVGGRPARLHRSKLKFAEYNPRIIDKYAFAKLKKSVKKFGLVSLPTVNVRTGYTIVGGHQRLKAHDAVLGTLDYELDVVLVDLSEAEEKSLNLQLNNVNSQGTWDHDKLADLLSSPGVNIADTGFDRADLALMFDAGAVEEMLGLGEGAKEQAGLEQAIVDELEEMRGPAKGKGGRDGQGKTVSNDAGEQSDSQGDRDSEGGNLLSGRESRRETEDFDEALSGGEGVDGGGGSGAQSANGIHGDGDPSDPSSVAAMKARRRDYIASSQDADDANFFIVLVAENSNQIDRFLSHFKIPVDERYIALGKIAERCGVEVGE